MSDAPADVLVVGAGIVGVMTALTLQQRGHATILVDREGPATGCSFGNGGAIGPNTATPFAMPGILRKVPKWYVDPDGPVTVRPSWAVRSAPFVLRWIRASRLDQARRSAGGMRFLHAGCLDAYRAALGPAAAADLLREDGYLYVYESEAPGENELTVAALREELGIPAQDLTDDEVREAEPSLGPAIRRATYLPGNGHTVNPKRLVETLFEVFRGLGGAFRRATVAEIRPGETIAVRTREGGELLARRLVLCTGVWSRPFAAALGVRLPLVAERGYHVTFTECHVPLNHKIMNGTRGFGATAMETGLQVTGTVELDDPDAPPNWNRADALARNAQRLFRTPPGGATTRWMGPRPSLPDSLPVVDRAPAAANIVFNFGHAHWGLSGAPRSAAIAADIIDDRDLPPETNLLRAGRFG
ncbi:NAD(P)/FAD-dependent oxidoreductase [Acuticoccus sediminis]|uniref:NAD(P)/FAD-dependent oxidoreductase n=1 Tax=Acuticoccus sediminis TaxID=2184697 RepID=UPI001CFF07E0|nr:FAD-dependent oxidoreductase [Acuticoccus sediminis]